ncbi:hypothetical protein ACIBQ1_56300 [Nonomuraea sp. NPDC050153]|uniref:hypothetical protein n=1 Tax=Nonomuraea sp. NPDC050153 TaxID=3364359 RepID=UPI00378C2D65
MSRIGEFATVLAISTSAAVTGSTVSPAMADGHPVIDVVDNVIPNANVLSNLLPNLNVSPSIVCIPTAQNTSPINGNHNQTTINQANTCTQAAQQTTPPPSGGEFSGYEVLPVAEDTCEPNDICTVTILCPPGKNVIEGSYTIQPFDFVSSPSTALQNASGTTYTVSSRNRSEFTGTLSVRVSCADVTP